MGRSRRTHAGRALTEKQDRFVRLIAHGVSNREACRLDLISNMLRNPSAAPPLHRATSVSGRPDTPASLPPRTHPCCDVHWNLPCRGHGGAWADLHGRFGWSGSGGGVHGVG